MRIIYLHHAEREKTENRHDKELGNLEDITQRGVKQTELLAERLSDLNLTAIITSPYVRCKHTAEIINKYHNLEIVEDDRFNEIDYYNNETFEDMLKRNIEAIDDITKKYDDKSIILCVTSGVNLSAFICYFYNLPPSEDTPWAQAMDLTPVNFSIGAWDI